MGRAGPVKLGNGDAQGALETVDNLAGPAWFDLFVQYHGGMIALAAGNTEEAVRRLETGQDNRAGGQAANDTYVRIITALVRAYAKSGAVEAAQNLVDSSLSDSADANPAFLFWLTLVKSGRDRDLHRARRLLQKHPSSVHAMLTANVSVRIRLAKGEKY